MNPRPTHVEIKSPGERSSRTMNKNSNAVILRARAAGYWDADFARLERLLIAHGYRHPRLLTDRELAERVTAERLATSRLDRHLELVGGAL